MEMFIILVLYILFFIVFPILGAKKECLTIKETLYVLVVINLFVFISCILNVSLFYFTSLLVG
jgi:hypothetical protein